MFVLEYPLQNEDFFAAPVSMSIEHRARRPADERGMLDLEFVQRHDHQTWYQAGHPARLTGVDAHFFVIRRSELVQFDEQHAPRGAERGMFAARRIAQITAGRIVAAAIGEGSGEHEDFLAVRMPVLREGRSRCVADQRGGPTAFSSDPLEHAPFNARHGRGYPGERVAVDDDASGKIAVDLHHFSDRVQNLYFTLAGRVVEGRGHPMGSDTGFGLWLRQPLSRHARQEDGVPCWSARQQSSCARENEAP